MRQDERKKRIGIMQSSIKEAENPDYELLILKCCNEWGISIRVIKEYLKIALFNIKNNDN